MERNLPK
jgi:hypothetical protein